MKNKAVRSYALRLYGNPGKVKETLGNMLEYRAWLWDYVVRYYDKGEDATESTKGKGLIANQAFKRVRGMLKAGRNSSIITGDWFNCPKRLPLLCDGTLEESKDSTWDYWVKVANGPRLPAQTHRALRNALRRGGKLVKTCEIRQAKQGGLYARVFVEHETPGKVESQDYLGVDVGVNAGVARSDGYVGKDLHPILKRIELKRAEQRRQGHVKSSKRSACKQYLDREARRAINVCQRSGKSLAVESLKTLGNLQPSGSIGAWARQHFAKRCLDLAEVTGVTTQEVWPAYTSQTCPRCDFQHKDNRRGTHFECKECGYVAHADIIGARNVARKATGTFPRREREKAGIET
ncbi:MAG: transposase [Candidatus Uhrbacteria bacterium]|nr:transposase [Candidatus Uhrbacteria bacterium]